MLAKIDNVNGNNYSDNTLTPPIDSSLRQGDTTRRLMLHGGDGIAGEFSVIGMNKRCEELAPSIILDFDEKNPLQTQNSNINNNNGYENVFTSNNHREQQQYNGQGMEVATSNHLLSNEKQQEQQSKIFHEQTPHTSTHQHSVFQIGQKSKQQPHNKSLQHQTSILLSPNSRSNQNHKSILVSHPRHTYKSLSNVVHVSNDRQVGRRGYSPRKSKTLQDIRGKHQQFEVSPLKKRLHTHSHYRISGDKGDLRVDVTMPNSVASISSPSIHKNHKYQQQQLHQKYEFSMARSHYHNPQGIVTPTQEMDSLSDKDGKSIKLKRIWKAQGFMIITLVKKFVQKMQNLSYIRRFNKQTSHQFTVINDKAGFYDPLRGNYLLDDSIFRHRVILAQLRIFNSILLQKIVQMVQHKIPLIEPDSYVFVGGTIVMLTTLLLLLFFNPIFMAFQAETSQSGFLSSNLSLFCIGKLPMILFLGNGILHINTAYYQRGLIIIDRWKIIVHYLKGKMLVDLALVILFLIIDFEDIRILFMICILIIKKIQYLRRDLEDAITLQKKWSSIYELAKLALFVLMVAHFCGCLFWSVGIRTMYYRDKSWIINEGLENSSFYEKYISSLYYAIVTMLTVGYGDIHPYNFIEKEIVILIMIISCGVYAYSLNKIGVLIQEIPSEDNEFKQNFSSISLYMKKRNLEVKIQNEVKRYYQYLNWEKHNYSQNRDIMLDPLNQSLKRKVLMSINLQFLLQYKMFSLHFSLPFLQKLALVMKEQEFMPDDKVWESSDIEVQNRIFFIVRGQVRQLVNSQFVVKIIDEGGYFNEKSFVVDEISHVSFISTCVSTLVILEKKDFTEIIRQFPKDYEIYCKLRDQAKNLAFLSILDSKCETCELFTHNFNSCPQVNLKISKEKLIYQTNLNIPAERKPFIRQPLNPQKLFLSNSNAAGAGSVPMLIENSRHLNAISFRRYLVENIIDYIIDYNPLDLDEDSLIEYMKAVVDYNENYGEELQLETSPTQSAFQPPPAIPFTAPSLFNNNNNGNNDKNNNHRNPQQQQQQQSFEELHQSGQQQQQPLSTQDSKLFLNQDSKLQANFEGTEENNYIKDLATSNEIISSLAPNLTRPKRSSISHRSMLLLNTTTTSNLNPREQLQLIRSQKTNEILNNNSNTDNNNNYKTNPSDKGYFQKASSNSKTINTINEEGHIELPIFKNKNKETKLQQLQTLASLGRNYNNNSSSPETPPVVLDRPERILQQQQIVNFSDMIEENVNDLSEQNNSHVLVPDSNPPTAMHNIHAHNVINGYTQPFNFNHRTYLHQATSASNNNLPSPGYNYNNNNSIDQSVLSIAAIQSGVIPSNLTNNNLNQMNGNNNINKPNTPAKYFNNQPNSTSNGNIPLPSSSASNNSPQNNNYFSFFPRDNNNYNSFSTPKNANAGGNGNSTRAQRSLKKMKSSMISQSPRDDKIRQPSNGGHSQSQESATEKQLLQTNNNNNNNNIVPNYSSLTSNLLNNVFAAYSNSNPNARPTRQIFDGKVRFTQEIKDTSSVSHNNNNRNLYRQQNTFEKQETLSGRSQQQQQFQQFQSPNNPVSRLSPDSFAAAMSPPFRHTNDFSVLPDLDRACIYQYYFPYSNIDKVMSQLSELNERIREKQLREKRHENTAALPSKLERFMQKYNSKRDPLRQKSRSPSPLRKKRNKTSMQENYYTNNNTICNSPLLQTMQTQNNILHLFSANQSQQQAEQ